MSDDFHILREKLRIPRTEGLIERPRINSILSRSRDQFPATLISGRAGTGKTAAAADFAGQNERVSWFSVESTDFEWPAFSRYFSACLSETVYGRLNDDLANLLIRDVTEIELARFLITRFSQAYAGPSTGRSLIVLDDIHHIFEARWFEDFFNLLLYSMPPDTHLLLLCRSKPPGPLWRLRSKQMLNVIDEKVISFNAAETDALFAGLGLSRSTAREAHANSFGRISKLLAFAEAHSTILPSSPSS